jgi:hypothetical protein
MRRYWPQIVITVGILVSLCGVAYGIEFTSTRYNGPVPEMPAGYEYHHHVACMIRWIGYFIALVGAMCLAFRRVMEGDLTVR